MKSHALVLAVALLASSCNLFDPFDSPTSDAQLISAARACFNKGDIACAQENYEKLSGAAADIKNSEEAFLAVEAINAGMGAFVGAFGEGNINTGKAITSVANSIGSNASRSNRVAIFNAYKKADSVVDTHLKGLSRFVTGLALAAEMLAEAAATKGHLVAGDIASSATACLATGSGGCAASATCDAGATPLALITTTIGGDGSLTGASDSDVDRTELSLEVFNAAVTTINDSLAQMGVSSTSANITGFTSALAGVPGAAAAYERCYRQGLLEQGVGQ